MARRLARILATIAVTVAMAACGSDQGSDQGSVRPPTGSPGAQPSASVTAVPGTSDPSPAPTASGPAMPRAGTWARLEVDGKRPAPREDHTWTIAADGRTAYLFGGRDGATVFDDLWAFDLATQQWASVAIAGASPAGRFGHEAALLPDGRIAIWAGQAGADFFDDVWLLDPSAASWRRVDARGDVPVARYGSCSGIGPDGRLWVSHGFTANGVRFDDTKALDVVTERWRDATPTGAAPIERCLHACWWTSDDQLALYGGQTNGVAALGDLWFLSFDADGAPAQWTEAAGQEAAARQLPAVARRDGVTLIVGGRGMDGTPLADTWLVVDGSTDLERLQAPDPPPARSGAAMIYDAASDRMVLFGGRADEAFADAWELRLS